MARTIPDLIYRFAPRLLWRLCIRVYELPEATGAAGDLFKRAFGHDAPAVPRHFAVIYFPPAAAHDPAPRLVAYGHQRPFEDIYLGGGMCVDERAYRRLPGWLFSEVKRNGGLAAVLSRGSMRMLGDSPASFGHVGEPRARQADLRAGFVETGKPHLMVFWRRRLTEKQKAALIEKVLRHGAF